MKAPYETTHVRIPIPVKEQVLRIAEEFRAGGIPWDTQKLLTPIEARELAVSILKQKRSAKESIRKLLTGIYGIDFEL